MSKSKIPYEKKVEIARDHLEGRMGYTESWDERTTVKRPFVTGCISIKKKGARDFFQAVKTTNIQRT